MTDEARLARELEELAYAVSHDLRAPLRGLKHLCEWLVRDAGDTLEGEPRQYLSHMQERVARMDAMLAGLTDYSRAMRNDEAPETVQLPDAIGRAAAGLGLPADFVRHDELPLVHARPALLERVLREILDNARKHGGAGHVEVTSHAEDDRARIAVVDHGPGVAAGQHDRIFQLFQVLTSQTSEQGIGCGLPVARKAVDRMQGTIGAKDTPGGGLTVWFTLPRASL